MEWGNAKAEEMMANQDDDKTIKILVMTTNGIV